VTWLRFLELSLISDAAQVGNFRVRELMEWRRSLCFLPLATVLVPQCGPYHRQADQSINANVQPKDLTDDCGFSKLGPMKPRATYSSPVISMPQAIYPDDAKARGIKGAVTVLLLVNVRSV